MSTAVKQLIRADEESSFLKRAFCSCAGKGRIGSTLSDYEEDGFEAAEKFSGGRCMVITRQLTDFEKVEMIYYSRMKKDFPRDELKPLDSIRQLWEENAYECYTLLDESKTDGDRSVEEHNDGDLPGGDEILGYAFFVRRDRDYLFDYFAISEQHQNEGLGSLFLRQLGECVKEANCVVGEVEDPEASENEKIRAEGAKTAVLSSQRLSQYWAHLHDIWCGLLCP